MRAKYNQESFIEAAKEVHGCLYKYHKVLYKAMKDKVEIVCDKHGSFWLSPTKHIDRKQGCLQCAIEDGKYVPPHTKESFITAATKVHGNRYTYKDVEYVGNKKKVYITCGIHGNFSQTPNSHLLGRNCPECSKLILGAQCKSNTQDFIFAAILKHGDKYSYNKVDYVSSTKKVCIICNVHNKDFMQSPNSHLMGADCPDCGKSGYNRNKPGSFYILKEGDITKVGITNVSVNKRLGQINSISKHDFEIVHSQYFAKGEDALNLETIVLRHLRQNHRNPEIQFSGSTECFFDVNLAELLAFVTPLNRI